MDKEKNIVKKILLRIIVVVKNISKNNLAFYGKKKMKTLIKVIMEFFLSLVEIIEEFNPIMQEHIPAYLTW